MFLRIFRIAKRLVNLKFNENNLSFSTLQDIYVCMYEFVNLQSYVNIKTVLSCDFHVVCMTYL